MIITESRIVIKNRFEANNQSISMILNNDNIISTSNITKIINLLLDLDKISENGRNIYE